MCPSKHALNIQRRTGNEQEVGAPTACANLAAFTQILLFKMKTISEIRKVLKRCLVFVFFSGCFSALHGNFKTGSQMFIFHSVGII